ncbi:MAG: DUF3782 domain-containing protein [Magnetococcales bacterium]|nr:DUF3782 domain-containing protein [Magnetococcales bacterium]
MRRQTLETDRLMKETDRKMQETDRRMQETDRKMQETDRIVKEVSRQIGQLGGRWGEFVEGLVAPACETLFAERGIPVHAVTRRMKAKHPDGRLMEIDILVENTDEIMLVEVKSELKESDVRDHLNRLAQFKEFFPYFEGKRIMGAVAGIVVEENVARFASNQGLFVIAQSGDCVHLVNGEGFTPCTW